MEKIAIVFPGQGSHYIGMGKSFYENCKISKHTYEEASEAAGFDIAKLCFEGTISSQNKFTNMQIIVVTTAVAMFRSYMDNYSVIPQFFAGHSVGEYAAYVCSGALDLSDAIHLLHQRGKLLDSLVANEVGHMTIVERITYQQVKNCFTRNEINNVYISCINSSYQFAICGKEKDINCAEKALRKIGANVTPIYNSPPMHTPIIQKEIVDEFYQCLSNISIKPFSAPVITNCSSSLNCNEDRVAEDLTLQLTKPVNWTKITEEIDKYGTTMLIEMGPKKLLCNFDEANNRNYQTYCFGVESDQTLLKEKFKNSECLKRDRVDFLGRCLKLAVSMKNNNYDSEEYNRQVIHNYNNLLTYEGKDCDERTMVTIADILLKILKGKKVTKGDMKREIHKVINETNSHYILREWYNDQFAEIS